MPSRGFQMVRFARLGLAMAPTLSLKVLANFTVALPTGYEQISTKSKPTGEEDEEEIDGK